MRSGIYAGNAVQEVLATGTGVRYRLLVVVDTVCGCGVRKWTENVVIYKVKKIRVLFSTL